MNRRSMTQRVRADWSLYFHLTNHGIAPFGLSLRGRFKQWYVHIPLACPWLEKPWSHWMINFNSQSETSILRFLKANTPNQMDHTMWKSMTKCAQKKVVEIVCNYVCSHLSLWKDVLCVKNDGKIQYNVCHKCGHFDENSWLINSTHVQWLINNYVLMNVCLLRRRNTPSSCINLRLFPFWYDMLYF